MISILSKAATWSPEQPFGEAFSRVFSSRLCSAQLIWTAVGLFGLVEMQSVADTNVNKIIWGEGTVQGRFQVVARDVELFRSAGCSELAFLRIELPFGEKLEDLKRMGRTAHPQV